MTEIFAVGETLALIGEIGQWPASLRVTDPRELASLEISGSPDRIWITLDGEESLGPDRATEALRMAFRIAQKAWSEAAISVRSRSALSNSLAADGFTANLRGVYTRVPHPLALTGPKAASSPGSYAHILDVHWNFVPAEVTAYEPLLGITPMRILDLGSGFGKNARVLARSGHSVTAIEAAPVAVERARTFVPEVRSLVASAADLPFEDSSFDAVVDVGCLHCMTDKERPAAVREIARVLVGDGVVYSRIFKPRPLDWVSRQPFEARTFGMTEDEVREVFRGWFEPHWWLGDTDAHYLRLEPGATQ